jgi:hypothetical protein
MMPPMAREPETRRISPIIVDVNVIGLAARF